VNPQKSHPACGKRVATCGDPRRSVEDTPCRTGISRKLRETLAERPVQAVEISYALLRESGIGQRRRSARRGNSSRWSGDATAGTGADVRSTGSVTGPVNRRALATHTCEGPSPFPGTFCPARPPWSSPADGVVARLVGPTDRLSTGPPAGLWKCGQNCGRQCHSCGEAMMSKNNRRKPREKPCARRLQGIEISYALLRESGIGRKRRTARRGNSTRWLGDEAIGTGAEAGSTGTSPISGQPEGPL
jgi:hypothetical protein